MKEFCKENPMIIVIIVFLVGLTISDVAKEYFNTQSKVACYEAAKTNQNIKSCD